MVPRGPILQIIRPNTTSIGTRGIDRGKRIVQGHIACNCHENRADEIKQAANEQITSARFLPADERTNGKHQTTNRAAKKHGEEPSIKHDEANRLHARYSLRRRNASQSPHNEIRKSEKDSSHKTRAECCDKRQEVE